MDPVRDHLLELWSSVNRHAAPLARYVVKRKTGRLRIVAGAAVALFAVLAASALALSVRLF